MKKESILIDAPHLGANAVLEVDAIWQAGSDTVALICHPNPVDGGTMNNKVVSTLFRYARDLGYNAVRYNSRGVGKSSGTAAANAVELADARAVLAWLATQTNARKLWLAGFSFGGYIACLLADFLAHNADHDGSDGDHGASFALTKLALIAPSVKRCNLTDLRLPSDKTFVVYGKNDEIVPPAAIQQFIDDNNLSYKICETGHFFHGQLPQLRAAIGELDKATA